MRPHAPSRCHARFGWARLCRVLRERRRVLGSFWLALVPNWKYRLQRPWLIQWLRISNFQQNIIKLNYMNFLPFYDHQRQDRVEDVIRNDWMFFCLLIGLPVVFWPLAFPVRHHVEVELGLDGHKKNFTNLFIWFSVYASLWASALPCRNHVACWAFCFKIKKID
jgi:hypothetical protein